MCRYYAVCLPLRAGLIWTKSKAGMVCLLSWLLSVLLTSPILAIAKYKDDPHNPTCTTDVDPKWTKGFFLSIISLFFWLPLFILVMLYAIIARSLTAGVTVTKHTGARPNNIYNVLINVTDSECSYASNTLKQIAFNISFLGHIIFAQYLNHFFPNQVQ